jgi:glycosyltransferase involved in cell wall biosynthesis
MTDSPPRKTTDIAFYLPQLGTGGVGKMRVLLTAELIRRGFSIDLLLGNSNGPYLKLLDRSVNVFNLGTTHALSSIPRLMTYLWRRRPTAIITDRLRLDIAVSRALQLTRVSARSYTSVHIPLSEKLTQLNPRKRKAYHNAVQRYYPKNRAIITVSAGVRSDLIDTFGISPHLVHTIYNPVVSASLLRDAKAPVAHPFFAPQSPPVVLSVGRLTEQKDFPTLIRAFAQLRAQIDCRLVILGEGENLSQLTELVQALGIGADVSFPGFAANPYAYMSRASLFVLSSAWEGLGNVLIEALAVGTPVVATDCRYGPREILADGKYGPLAPVGDEDALATAMQAVIEDPPPADILQKAASRYTVARSCEAYLDVMGFQQSKQPT